MSEKFIHKVEGDQPDDRPEAENPKQAALREAREKFGKFRDQYEKMFNGYSGTPDIPFTVQPGGWYIDMDKLRINADPTFFMEKGFSESEAIFASLHEIEHFRDMIRDDRAYHSMFQRHKEAGSKGSNYGRALGRLYNCVDDVLVNKAVMSRWAAGKRAKASPYPKLFPRADLRGDPGQSEPRHRQFMYALLRRAMLPDEETTVEPEVQAALERAIGRGEGRADLLQIMTEVTAEGRAALNPDQRFGLMEKIIEPIFQELYQKDVQDRQRKNKDKQSGKGEPQDGEPGEDFGDDPFQDAIPDPIDFGDMKDKLDEIKKAKKNKATDQFKEVMGVERKDYDSYMGDLRRVEQYIDGLSQSFDNVISRRVHERRVLSKPAREGVILDPRRAATGYAQIKAGNMEPEMMLEYESRKSMENRPSELEFTLICDGSGSMQGGKATMQRRLAILVTEALAAFRDRIRSTRKAGQDVRLDVRTCVRVFSDSAYTVKPMSESLTMPERVDIRNKLIHLPFGGNNEEAVLSDLESEELGDTTIAKMQKGELKKIVVFLTDGETDSGLVRRRIKQLEDSVGTTRQGADPFIVAGIGFDGGQTAAQTYAPNGYYAESFEKVPEIFTQFLSKILDTL